MANNYQDLEGSLKAAMQNAIQIVADRKIDSAEIASTIQGTIVECKDTSIGKYLIKYQDSYIEAYAIESANYTKDTLVYVYVPNGDFSEYKVILGSPNRISANYIDYEGEIYEDDEQNLIEGTEDLEMCSYINEEVKLYEKDGTSNQMALSSDIEGVIRNRNTLKMSGTIQTRIPSEQKVLGGRYGIKVTLIMKDSATGEEKPQDFYFSSELFLGNPFEYETASYQEVYTPIEGNNYAAVASISYFVQDFPYGKTREEWEEIPEKERKNIPDISISNFCINGSYQLTEADRNKVTPIIKAPQGYTFTDKEHDDMESKSFELMIKANMKDVDLKNQNVAVYWFKQDLSITSRSPQFSRIGGLGWRCLNQQLKEPELDENGNEVKKDGEVVYRTRLNQYIPSSSIKIYYKDVKYAKTTPCKAVAIYENKSYPREFQVLNNAAKYDIQLESDSGTSFSYSAGSPTLTCNLYSSGEKVDVSSDTYKFYWQIENNQGIVTELEEAPVEQATYERLKRNLKTLKNLRQQTGEIQSIDTPITDSVYLEDCNFSADGEYTYGDVCAQYERRIAAYEKKQKVKKNVLYNLDLHQIIKSSIIRCSCWEVHESEGILSNSHLIGSASLVIKNDRQPFEGYKLIINNGEQVFLYNEEGTSLQSEGMDEPYKIFPLSYTLYYNGIPIEEKNLQNGVIATWYYPISNTMIQMGTDESSTVSPVNGYKQIKGRNKLQFDVSNTFDYTLNNNDILLRLEYKDQVFEEKTHFTFTKQGQNGTNGTKYQFKIELENNPEAIVQIEKSTNPFHETSFPLVAKMWKNGESDTEGFDVQSWKILNNHFLPVKEENKDAVKIDYSLDEGKKVSNIKYVLRNSVDLTDDNFVNIIEAESEKNGFHYYADLPVTIIQILPDNIANPQANEDKDRYTYTFQVEPESGFKYVTYKSDGTQPKYNNRLPFKVNVFRNGEDVSNFKSEKLGYFWEIYPKKIQDEDEKSLSEQLLTIVSSNTNECRVIPKSIFKRGNQVNNAVILTIKKGKDVDKEDEQGNTITETIYDKKLAYVYFPVHLMLNKYENQALNSWNGTSIEINKEGGYILTPQVGAGKKGKDNSFTGVVLGVSATSENGEINNETGLFAYGDGERSIFLDAKTGNATFGKAGGGQIVIDVTGEQDKATIASSDYNEEDFINKNGTGMEIQFSGNPHIRFGSGNFYVESDGTMHATAGEIAGWQIKEDRIQKIQGKNWVGMSPGRNFITNTDVDTSGELNNVSFWAGTSTSTSNNRLDPNFYVTQDGFLYSKSGNIAGWKIEKNSLSKITPAVMKDNQKVADGNYAGISPGISLYVPNSTIKAKNDYLNNVSFWAGTWDTSGGKTRAKPNFFVMQDGFLYSKSGNIAGWEIAENELSKKLNGRYVGISTGTNISAIVNNKNEEITNTCFWAGNYDSNKSRLLPNFYVKQNGYLFSKYGKIGNWYIGEGGLYQGTSTFKNDKDEIIQKSKDVYVGSDGIRLGTGFHVDDLGTLYAISGTVGGCTLSSGGISGNSWDIPANGSASFTGVKINGVELKGNITGNSTMSGYSTASGGGGWGGNGWSSNGNKTLMDGNLVKVKSAKGEVTLQKFIEDLAEEIVTKRLSAEWVWIDEGLSANIVRARGSLYIGSGPDATNVNSQLNAIWTALSNKQDKTTTS